MRAVRAEIDTFNYRSDGVSDLIVGRACETRRWDRRIIRMRRTHRRLQSNPHGADGSPGSFVFVHSTAPSICQTRVDRNRAVFVGVWIRVDRAGELFLDSIDHRK